MISRKPAKLPCPISVCILAWLASGDILRAQAFNHHKSRAQIERMSPDERVEEYCREYAVHSDRDLDYVEMLNEFIDRDGLAGLPRMIKEINDFDPSPRAYKRERDARCFMAVVLLGDVDETVVRLRATEDGRKGINAVDHLVSRMRAAHFDVATGDEYPRRLRYEYAVDCLKALNGVNMLDDAIRNTLRLRYGTELSSQELSDFVNYLISYDSSYPQWGRKQLYRDSERRNEAGNPLQYYIVQDAARYYKLFLERKRAIKQ
jgi:hypothetical protein